MANKVSILFGSWIAGALLVVVCSCQRLDEQPVPAPLPIPAQQAGFYSVGTDGVAYVELPSATELAGGGYVVRITRPHHGSLDPDFDNNRLIYTPDQTFDGLDTAAYTLVRGDSSRTKPLYFSGTSRACQIKALDDDTTVYASPTSLIEFKVLHNDDICTSVTIDPLPEIDSAGQPSFFRLGRKPGTIAWLGAGAVPGDYTAYYTIRKPGSNQVSQAKFTVHAIDCVFDPKEDNIRQYQNVYGQHGYLIPFSDLTANDGCPLSFDAGSIQQYGSFSNLSISQDAYGFTVNYYSQPGDSARFFHYLIQSRDQRDSRVVKVNVY